MQIAQSLSSHKYLEGTSTTSHKDLESSVSFLSLEKKRLSDKVSILEYQLRSANEMASTLRDRIQQRDIELLYLQKKNSDEPIRNASNHTTTDQVLFNSMKIQIPGILFRSTNIYHRRIHC